MTTKIKMFDTFQIYADELAFSRAVVEQIESMVTDHLEAVDDETPEDRYGQWRKIRYSVLDEFDVDIIWPLPEKWAEDDCIPMFQEGVVFGIVEEDSEQIGWECKIDTSSVRPHGSKNLSVTYTVNQREI